MPPTNSAKEDLPKKTSLWAKFFEVSSLALLLSSAASLFYCSAPKPKEAKMPEPKPVQKAEHVLKPAEAPVLLQAPTQLNIISSKLEQERFNESIKDNKLYFRNAVLNDSKDADSRWKKRVATYALGVLSYIDSKALKPEVHSEIKDFMSYVNGLLSTAVKFYDNDEITMGQIQRLESKGGSILETLTGNVVDLLTVKANGEKAARQVRPSSKAVYSR